MPDPIIVFDHVFKKFARGEHHTSLRDFIPAMTRKLWPFGKKKGPADLKGQEFWAVQDVSFKLHKGESMGIIGPNGSGKSTTLKLLSGILRPDRGTYTVKGRLSALIEVGAGFHPDLTGRENVFLNGSILGMTRKEVAAKFNDIVEFAGVEEFIDTPVKHYSSGMAVRLGFAVSAMVEPDVLLVDEVLAVGDTEFRSRCMHRMDSMRRNGVTMILVSHNLPEVRSLCENCLMLFKGQDLLQGPTAKVIGEYHKIVADRINVERDKQEAKNPKPKKPTGLAITKLQMLDREGRPMEYFGTKHPVTIRMTYRASERIARPKGIVELIWAAEEAVCAVFSTQDEGVTLGPIEPGTGTLDMHIPALLAAPYVYAIRAQLSDAESNQVLDSAKMQFVVHEGQPMEGIYGLAHTWGQPCPDPAGTRGAAEAKADGASGSATREAAA